MWVMASHWAHKGPKLETHPEIADVEDAYGPKWLKTKSHRRYGEPIYFAEISGRLDTIYFKRIAD